MIQARKLRCPDCGRLVPLPCVACAAERYRLETLPAIKHAQQLSRKKFETPQADCQHSGKIKRHGFDRHGKQRFRCLECGKSIFATQNRQVLPGVKTPLYVVERILEMILKGRSARHCARRLKIKSDTICNVVLTAGRVIEQRNLRPDWNVNATPRPAYFRAIQRCKSKAYTSAVLAIFVAWECVRSNPGRDRTAGTLEMFK